MNTFWSPHVGNLTPYVPGEQPRIERLVKLNTNENPYPPSPRAIAAIQAEAGERLRLYPDPQSTALKEALAAYHGVAPGEVFVGNGSDEVLAHAFHAFFQQDLPILMPTVSYSFYKVYCRLYGIDAVQLPLDEAMRIDPGAYARPAGGVVIANPNAPTGIALGLDDIERILRAHPHKVVLVDEAYVDFGAASAVALVRHHPNLLVVQTFSKSRALAGLRVGCAIGQAHLVEGLKRVKDSFNSYPLGRVEVAGAVAAIEDDAYFQAQRAKVIATRERLAGELGALGFEVLPSAANFVFARHAARRAADVARALRERAILVRHFQTPGIDDWLRISVGTDAQCGLLRDALAQILAG
ncbi:histidinol-phosphate transaminase [uncultured Massilia sp.]|uniref:histidinol-phosphate transaminase n=1 Tax=uncultured Massilia sp. TaxID=169973 RepID=UPI0025E29607|nr:histidinol-phosphate transaminase [uncultured Massilia sp.]